MSGDEARKLLRKMADKAGSLTALANQLDVNQSVLNKVVRGEKEIPEKITKQIRLVRRRTAEFYPEHRALDQIGQQVGLGQIEHLEWREANNIGNKQPWSGRKLITARFLAGIMGLCLKDFIRIAVTSGTFPTPDEIEPDGSPAWNPDTIYHWFLAKGRKARRNV